MHTHIPTNTYWPHYQLPNWPAKRWMGQNGGWAAAQPQHFGRYIFCNAAHLSQEEKTPGSPGPSNVVYILVFGFFLPMLSLSLLSSISLDNFRFFFFLLLVLWFITSAGMPGCRVARLPGCQDAWRKTRMRLSELENPGSGIIYSLCFQWLSASAFGVMSAGAALYVCVGISEKSIQWDRKWEREREKERRVGEEWSANWRWLHPDCVDHSAKVPWHPGERNSIASHKWQKL